MGFGSMFVMKYDTNPNEALFFGEIPSKLPKKNGIKFDSPQMGI